MTKTNITQRVQTYNWFKAMPKLMQEFFLAKIERGESCAFAKMMAEEKYYDYLSMAQENN